jgi:DNA gyrase subunit B
MIEPQYTSDDIKVIDAMTAIRTRPEMYVGPLADAAAINTLLTEAMCIALDNVMSGCATKVSITIHEDGSATVRDDGPGLNVDYVYAGMTAIELLLTQLYACRQAKRNRIAAELCGVGIVVTNALSEWLVVETVQDGWLWQQRYTRGHAEGPIEKLRECDGMWQQVSFRPDPNIFGSMQLSPSYCIQWFQEQPVNLGSATVILHHGKSSTPLRAAS